jgi:hypothetical protein
MSPRRKSSLGVFPFALAVLVSTRMNLARHGKESEGFFVASKPWRFTREKVDRGGGERYNFRFVSECRFCGELGADEAPKASEKSTQTRRWQR